MTCVQSLLTTIDSHVNRISASLFQLYLHINRPGNEKALLSFNVIWHSGEHKCKFPIFRTFSISLPSALGPYFAFSLYLPIYTL